MVGLTVVVWFLAGGAVTLAAVLGLVGGDPTGPWTLAYFMFGAVGVWMANTLRRKRGRLLVSIGSMILGVAYIAVGAYLVGNPTFTVVLLWPWLLCGGLIAGVTSAVFVARGLRLRVVGRRERLRTNERLIGRV